MTWGMSPGCAVTFWSIDFMAPGMVSEGFLNDPPGNFLLVFYSLLWEFPKGQATQGGSLLTLLSFLGIITLLDNQRRYLKEQWFSPWLQIRSSLLYYPKNSLVDHRLAMYYLVSLSPNASFSTSSNLMGIWGGLLSRVRRYSPATRISYWPKIWILQVTLQGDSFRCSSRVENLGGFNPFWYITMSPGDRFLV